MSSAARLLEGEHDFAAFQATGSDAASTVRTIAHCGLRGTDCSLAVKHELIELDVTGSGFLRHMVRAIAGSLVEVGRGRREPGWLAELVDGGRRSDAGPTAPAHGLFLVSVAYDGSDDTLAAEP
jgi:tRNA pseudouridine38-40 synthase